jgi:hypothetical protein
VPEAAATRSAAVIASEPMAELPQYNPTPRTSFRNQLQQMLVISSGAKSLFSLGLDGKTEATAT